MNGAKAIIFLLLTSMCLPITTSATTVNSHANLKSAGCMSCHQANTMENNDDNAA